MNTIKPTIVEIQEIIKKRDKKYIIPVWKEIFADLETPVSAFSKVCWDQPYSFLLESAEGAESFGRYSFIGSDPLFLFKSDQNGAEFRCANKTESIYTDSDPFELMKKVLSSYEAIDFNLPLKPGMVGYYGYDCVKFIEPKLQSLFDSIEDCTTFPNAYFMLAGTILVFDHYKHKVFIITNMLVDEETDIECAYERAYYKIENVLHRLDNSHNLPFINLQSQAIPQEVESNISKEQWTESINKAKEHILAGDIFQVVLSQRFCVDQEGLNSLTIYRGLRSVNPSPYLYYLNFDEFQIIGSSPEIMVKSDGSNAQIRPIAGTRKRGNTAEEDMALQKELLEDKKEVAEHVMLVDLGRNDLGRVCDYGSVKVTDFMTVEKYSHVQHIVSNVTGKLKEGVSSVDLLKACFPAGTVSGAPKVRAMEIIYQLEKSARGPYAGCIGYLGFDNSVNTAITIRTMLVRNGKIYIQAGAGIVADSLPENEYVETQNKAAALVHTLAQLR